MVPPTGFHVSDIAVFVLKKMLNFNQPTNQPTGLLSAMVICRTGADSNMPVWLLIHVESQVGLSSSCNLISRCQPSTTAATEAVL